MPLTVDEEIAFSVKQTNRSTSNIFVNGNNNISIFKNGLSKNILMVVQIESPVVWHIHKEQWQ